MPSNLYPVSRGKKGFDKSCIAHVNRLRHLLHREDSTDPGTL